MATRITQVSFTRGELTPRLDARTNLEQYSIGLKSAKNAIIHQEGGISNRMGLEYCGIVKNSSKFTRVIRFVFNTTQTYMLEFGDKYIRFLQDGAYIIYPDNYGITYAGMYQFIESGTNESDEQYYKYKLENDDYIYTKSEIATDLTCYKDAEFKNIYQSGVSSSLSKGIITSLNTENTLIGIDEDNDKIAKRGEIVEIESPYLAEDLPLIKCSRAGDILTLTYSGKYNIKNLSRYSHYDWILEDAVFKPSLNPPSNLKAQWKGETSSNTREYQYVVTAVDEKTDEESERSEIVKATGHREANWLEGEEMTLQWDPVDGAVEYNIYRNVNGIFGYIGTAQETSFTDDCIEPDLSSSAPVAKDPFADGQTPGCSCYFQQRKVFGNLPDSPQAIVTSQTGAINNFNVSRPLVATDSITINIDGNEEVRHLIPMKDLIVLTSDSEWMVNGTDGIMQANPAPAAVIQSCYGASHVEPIVSGSMVIFVQSGGSVVRDLGYDLMTDKYDGDELSLFSNHLFEGKEIRCIAYAKEPYRLVFVIFTDGSAVTMTYNKKQKLCGWTRLETDGLFEWVDVIREGLEDIAYFVIQREINGQKVKYIERTKTRIINDAKDAFLVDSGLSAKFETPVFDISGLEHLEGKQIIANVNGGIIENLVVHNGQIKLPKAAKTIVVGLPYEFDFETLNIEGENTQGLRKVVNHVTAKIHKSREDFIFVGEDGSEFRNYRSDASINNSGLLFSTDKSSTVFANATTEATIHIKQNYPLPLTILSVSCTVDVQDNENS